MQVKLTIVALGAVLMAGPLAAQPYPYHPYGPNPYWGGTRYYAPPVYVPPPVYAPPAYMPPTYVPPAYVRPYSPPMDHRALVDAIQDELDEHGYQTGPTDGVLDYQTVAAIRAYQRDAGLPIDGEATPRLLDHLRHAQPPVHARTPEPSYNAPTYNAPAQPYQQQPTYQQPYQQQPPYQAQPTYPTQPEGQPPYIGQPEQLTPPDYTQRPGMAYRGDPDVAWVQQALQRRGYTPGAPDGVMGERTRRAIEAFQRDNGLPVDGTINPTLLNRLR
ncbi:peptidoglycan hydrolase-like protein with peptidoglycan-binding domain [Stella humosa]|uniref:Peptidoglycan hydrolase-like protein with peptidoglycan-binding domain n=1 Tax=Stella humosa TaxID=94 RepID=A0A3N1KW08_9PROT|nr:peptidoglycan-binding domain-containing protein [Stella humosa]ROP84124.1 peptidoglycan hydrolase-like protein with peptidoglycan-binding domain [Stella humosa]BBK33634.1 hypothetical protein STHU_42680 [Stella humosa]